MNTQPAAPNENIRKARIAACLGLLTFLLAACSASAPASQPPEPAGQPPAGGHAPVILRVEKRDQVEAGDFYHHEDIYFTDPDGDAVVMTYAVTSSTLHYPLKFPDTPIEATAEQQRVEALYSEAIRCWQKLELAYEARIRDGAGNLSEPVRIRLSCTAPQPLDARPLLVLGLAAALAIALVLLLGFWLLFRKRPAGRLPALRSMLLLFCLFMLLKFLQVLLHEGGHSLYPLLRGVPTTLYVHPFLFAGYSRPYIVGAGSGYDMLGSAIALPVGLLLSALFWKRRSTRRLPLLMLFPFIALNDGFNVMGMVGDFWNVAQSTGLPGVLFLVLGAVIVCIGMLSLFSLLPLAGLDPGDPDALFVLPAAVFLAGLLSFLAAHLFVPGSPIDLEYFLGREILASATLGFAFTVIFFLLAVLYVTLFRKLSPRLPAWLRSGTTRLNWKDLSLPGILWAVSVVIGLIAII